MSWTFCKLFISIENSSKKNGCGIFYSRRRGCIDHSFQCWWNLQTRRIRKYYKFCKFKAEYLSWFVTQKIRSVESKSMNLRRSYNCFSKFKLQNYFAKLIGFFYWTFGNFCSNCKVFLEQLWWFYMQFR